MQALPEGTSRVVDERATMRRAVAVVLGGLMLVAGCAETQPAAAPPREPTPAATEATPAPPASSAAPESTPPTEAGSPASAPAVGEWRVMKGVGAWILGSEADVSEAVQDTPHSVRVKGRIAWLDLREAAARPLLAQVSGPLSVNVTLAELNDEALVTTLRSLAAKYPMRLMFRGTPASTPSELGRLGEIQRLDALALLGLVKPGEIAKLATQTELRELDVTATGVTDDDLKHLAGLTKLERLTLSNNRGIDDAGLEHLRGLKALTLLRLQKTKATPAGLDALQGQLPKAKIER